MSEKKVVPENELEQRMCDMFDEFKEIFMMKNRMYKNASFDLGMKGNYVHLYDKVKRLQTLVWDNEKEVYFESAKDTLYDISIYAAIGAYILEKEEQRKKSKL